MCSSKKDPYKEVTDSLDSENNPVVGSNIDSSSDKEPLIDDPLNMYNVGDSSKDGKQEEIISKLSDELASEKDSNLRLQAEIDNLRKRSSLEILNASKFAIEEFANNLLPVLDSLEAAINLEEQTEKHLKSGVELTLKQLSQSFERAGIVTINPNESEKFDPNQHQAVSTLGGNESVPPVKSGHVISVLQKGYLLSGRVLRPALVVVAA